MASYRRVPIAQAIVDARYQRDLNPRHPALVDPFDEALLGVLEGSERSNGKVAMFDGQHRLERLKREGRANVPTMVHTGLTPEEEADLFRRLQEGRKSLTPVETFNARLFAEDPVAVSMNAVADAAGYTIGTGPGSLQAVVAVERVFRRGNLEETLALLKLWKGERRALESGMIDGLSRFLDLYPEADRDRIKEILADCGSATVWRRQAEFVDQFRYSRARAVLEALRALVSSRKHPLPLVANAMESRVEGQRAAAGGGGIRYRRVTLEEVRDAARELGSFYPEQLAERLGIAGRSLTKSGGYLPQLMSRSIPVIQRHRQGSTGRYFYEYLSPKAQVTAPAKRTKAPTPESLAAANAPENGHGPSGNAFRVSDPEVQKIIEEVIALGAPLEDGGSHVKVLVPGGGKPVTITKSKARNAVVKRTRANLRRAGIKVRR